MINQIQQNYCNQPTFKNNSLVSGEIAMRRVEFAGRKLINSISDIFVSQKNNVLFDELMSTDIKSEDYIKVLANVSRMFANKKEVEINTETKRIEKIAQSNSPHIFIMNHDNQKKDPKMLAFFNTLLSYAYMQFGLAKTCPRPKIILNEDIILSMKKQNQNIFKKIGAVGIDASLHTADKRANAQTFMTLIRSFLNKEINLFIFPEGRKSAYKYSPLVEKFQLGIAEIAAKLTDRMSEVNVTPLGFAYGKRTEPDAIYVGETVVLKKQKSNIEVGIGNIESSFARENYKKFFNGREHAILTNNGVPVEGKELSSYIGGVLCENLRICKEEAIASINKS